MKRPSEVKQRRTTRRAMFHVLREFVGRPAECRRTPRTVAAPRAPTCAFLLGSAASTYGDHRGSSPPAWGWETPSGSPASATAPACFDRYSPGPAARRDLDAGIAAVMAARYLTSRPRRSRD